MLKRQRIPCRLAAGAKLFAVLLAMAALPALTLGQISRPKAEPAGPGAANEKKAAEVQSLFEQLQKQIKENSARLKVIDAEFEPKKVENASADEKLIREIEARIAELKKQLEVSKARKQAVEAPKPAQPPQPPALNVTPGPGKIRIWTADGKSVEPAPKTTGFEFDLKFDGLPGLEQLFRGGAKPGQPLRILVEDTIVKPPPYKVIGPDGKEIKGAKIVPVAPSAEAAPAPQVHLDEARKKLEEMLRNVRSHELKRTEMLKKPGPKEAHMVIDYLTVIGPDRLTGAGNIIPLSRATYHLPKEKAEALAAFLKANVKTAVLEFKIDGEGLTITTAPEAQVAIGNFVKLMQGPPTKSLLFELHMLDKK